MGIEGRLSIDLARRPDGIGEARIASTRPLGLTRALEGKPIDDTVRTVPLLFNVCGMAQGTAAAEAAERARDATTDPGARTARSLLVLAETAREHLLRIVGDWARLTGAEHDPSATLAIMRTWEALRRAIDPGRRALLAGAHVPLARPAIADAIAATRQTIETIVTWEPVERFCERSAAAHLDDWDGARRTAAQQLVGAVRDRGWEAEGCCEACFLPPAPAPEIAARLLAPDVQQFVREPSLDGVPRETSPLGRQIDMPLVRALAGTYGHGLLTRITARIVEIARLPSRMLATLDGAACAPDDGIASASPTPGTGVAYVEAARGRLMHAIETHGHRVGRYAILAPTEWNFHPEGSGCRSLAAIASRGPDVRDIADLFIATLDPCVAYDLRIA